MTHYRVFLGAPSISDLKKDPAVSYTWKTVEPPSAAATQALVYPPATLEAASRRISLLYQNIIFDESNEQGSDEERSEGSQLLMNGMSSSTIASSTSYIGVNRTDDGDNLACDPC
jgi:hypothetical protein